MTYSSDGFKTQIVQRIFRNFLDIMLLRLVQTEPMWGYKLIQVVERTYGVRLRHGALYPMLNDLEKTGFLRSTEEAKGGRIRKVYTITSKGIQLVDAYYQLLKGQLQEQDIEVD
jgi:PadR family transcriptional regulator PadR